MELNENNLDGFLSAMKKRLANELSMGMPIYVATQNHYPEPRTVKIGEEIFPYPATGETISIQIGFRSEELPSDGLY